MPYRAAQPDRMAASAITCTPTHPGVPTVVLDRGKCHLIVSMSGWGPPLVEMLAGHDVSSWQASTDAGPLSRDMHGGYRGSFSMTRWDQLRYWVARRFPPTRRIERALRQTSICGLYEPLAAIHEGHHQRIKDAIRRAVSHGSTVVVCAGWRSFVDVADVFHALPANGEYRHGSVEATFRPAPDGPFALDAEINTVHGTNVVRFGAATVTVPEQRVTIHGTRVGPHGREGFTTEELQASFHVPARAVTIDPEPPREDYAVMTGKVLDRYRVGTYVRIVLHADAWRFHADVPPDRAIAVGDTVTFGFSTAHVRS